MAKTIMKNTFRGDELDGLLKIVEYIEKRIREALEHNSYCEADFEMKNTGITQLPLQNTSGWAEHVDLGGRSFKIDISFPNNITMSSALKKLNKANG